MTIRDKIDDAAASFAEEIGSTEAKVKLGAVGFLASIVALTFVFLGDVKGVMAFSWPASIMFAPVGWDWIAYLIRDS